MFDLSARLRNRVQLTSDGHKVYLQAVEDAFGVDIDYAMLVKLYGRSDEPDSRYSPPQCIGTSITPISGQPDRKHVSTSYIERQDLNMRMQMRRFTRLTNGFSKKLDNHIHSLALFHMHHNFCRIHQTLRVTPAMEAGISQHMWSVADLVRLSASVVKLAA